MLKLLIFFLFFFKLFSLLFNKYNIFTTLKKFNYNVKFLLFIKMNKLNTTMKNTTNDERDERLYNTFESVEELEQYFNIKNINESKANKKQENENVKSEEDYPVVYADLKTKELKNIFRNIIVFTNSKNQEQNKTLKNLYESVENLKKHKCKTIPKLFVFLAEETIIQDNDGEIISITDGDTKIEFTDENNTDTLIISRLGVQGEELCEHIVSLLQDRGFLVLNPIKFSKLASNKYDTAQLLEKANIPQPKYCLMNKDILYDENLYNKNMKSIYDEWDSKNTDKNKDLSFVVKILDGHGGTGVFLIDGKRIFAVLQTLFAVSPKLQLLIQRKEEADGGDIRVHVLTLKNKQVILGAMKRVKLSGDFRSNVSLGASAETIKLTPEQEQIALKTAKISKLPWCAVDIMPLVKGSNKQLGDNVVLEINASPGTDGISNVLKTNFINIILNELTDPKDFQIQDKTAGYQETVSIDFGNGNVSLLAKLDTGNGTKASHVEVGKLDIKDNKVSFTFFDKKYELEIIDTSNAVTGSETTPRPIVNLKTLKLGQRQIENVPMALVESRNKSTNMLLNRDCLAWLGYNVSSYQTHVLTKEMEKIKII